LPLTAPASDELKSVPQLAVLRREEPVETRRDAKQVFYRISSPAALAVIHTLYQQFRVGETS
jgi:ArsR family transcriptional regulator